MRSCVLVVSLLGAAAAVHADTVYLKNGGRLSGVVLSRTESAIEIEMAAGRVTIPMKLVARVEGGESSLSQYQARARSLAPNDVAGWLELAEWARNAELNGQARDAYEHVLALDPGNAAAHRGLEHQRVGDQWMPHDDAMRAKGYVFFEGQWVTPAHRDATLAEYAADRRERTEAETARLTLAAAEARAREAEAHARAAEADAERAHEPTVVVVPVRGRDHRRRRPIDDGDYQGRFDGDYTPPDSWGKATPTPSPSPVPSRTPAPTPRPIVLPPIEQRSIEQRSH